MYGHIVFNYFLRGKFNRVPGKLYDEPFDKYVQAVKYLKHISLSIVRKNTFLMPMLNSQL